MFKSTLVLALSLVSTLAVSAAAHAATSVVCDMPMERSVRLYTFKAKTTPPGIDSQGTLKIKGERAARRLTCVAPAIEPGRGMGDRRYTILECFESRRGGYSVTVRSGGLTGGMIAVIAASRGDDTRQTLQSLYCNMPH